VVGYAAEFPSEPYGFEILTQTSTSISFTFKAPVYNGGLTIISFEVQYDDGLLTFNTPIDIGYQLTYVFTVPSGGEGKLFGFKVRAKNSIGAGAYSSVFQMMAADVPNAPSMTLVSRSLNGFDFLFQPDAVTGNSPIIGYLLYIDEGILGSPF
jgi:hypothetical protein